jgi:L-2-hydroxyglutarate oxidase LhgO
MEHVDALVVGAGVVGLAIARELALRGREVFVLEAEDAVGTHASSRNTGVIHAGLDYKPGSLKARLCRRGRDLLYRYCEDRGVAHKRLGKLITISPDAGEDELAALHAFRDRAVAGGCDDLVLLGRADVKALEPALAASAAVLSPSSGILDHHELMTALWGDFANSGGHVLFGAPMIRGCAGPDGLEVEIGGRHRGRVRCGTLVNSAGVDAPLVARALALPQETIPPRLLQKGSYCVYLGASPFSRLIYPLKHGVHASLDIAGHLRFGPDSQWVDTVDYSFDDARIAPFYEKARVFWPELPDGRLGAGWTAVRSKITRDSPRVSDFVVQDARSHGVEGLLNLYGIESPGLTSCLALAEEVAARLAHG